jgi:organic hydroperoxide reductase OsmC/OhrA
VPASSTRRSTATRAANPEDLLVASLSGCHMLWYLHLCAVNKVVVLEYEDNAAGTIEVTADGGGRFVEVTLRPTITITAQSSLDTAQRLHHDAHEKCFIANSVNFPVRIQPEFHAAS